jgi:uncharacterized iron-regulated membrane protein
MVGFTERHPQRPGGGYGFRLTAGADPYRYWNFSGNAFVAVDSHGGGVQDWAPREEAAPLSQRLWNDGWYDGLHFGTLVGPLPRVVLLVFGLSPLLLGVTGLTVWWTKSRSARNRRRRLRAAGLGPFRWTRV